MTKTPQYIFESKSIIESYEHMCKCLSHCDVYYALKANSELEILEVLNSIQAKFEIASEGELNKLINLKVPPDRIICSLPVKKMEMIKNLYAYGCKYFVFDCVEELEKIKKNAPEAVKILRVYTNDIIKNNIPFGMEICDLYRNIEANGDFQADIDGITFYLRKNYNYDNLEKILDRVEEIFKRLGTDRVRYLNIGGNYRPEIQAGVLFYEKLNDRLINLVKDCNLKLLAEVGRSVVKFSGKLYTRVELVKNKGAYSEVFIDAGLPTGISYAPKKINVVNRDDRDYKSSHKYQFYGITCSHALLFEMETSSKLQTGDLLEFEDFGSYSICKHSNFHGWDKPLIALI